jgi:hypothetical protein
LGAGNEKNVTVSKFFQAGNKNELTVTIFKLVGNGNDLTVTSGGNDAHLWSQDTKKIQRNMLHPWSFHPSSVFGSVSHLAIGIRKYRVAKYLERV